MRTLAKAQTRIARFHGHNQRWSREDIDLLPGIDRKTPNLRMPMLGVEPKSGASSHLSNLPIMRLEGKVGNSRILPILPRWAKSWKSRFVVDRR
jgi:hypothetical protein